LRAHRSHSELKRREKQREKDAKKAEKAAAAPPQAVSKPAAANEDDLNPNASLLCYQSSTDPDTM
jgi:hypothetical protein